MKPVMSNADDPLIQQRNLCFTGIRLTKWKIALWLQERYAEHVLPLEGLHERNISILIRLK